MVLGVSFCMNVCITIAIKVSVCNDIIGVLYLGAQGTTKQRDPGIEAQSHSHSTWASGMQGACSIARTTYDTEMTMTIIHTN